jgi:predicted CoA-substrate-specific enzyme activase
LAKKLFAGVDVGSSATKVVIVDETGTVLGRALEQSGMDFVAASKTALEKAIKDAGISSDDIAHITSSGYGRKNVEFANDTKTEIACHARGAYRYFREAITIVDIGGQDNKIIKVGADGSRLDFKMNRKCAAGTGAFLEEIARRMNVDMSEMDALARSSEKIVTISSFCTVFAATEILSLIRQGAQTRDIARGAFHSVVKRVVEMDSLTDKVVATGGVVSHNPIVLELMTESIGHEVLTPPEPQFSGALGAAFYAVDEARQ